MAQKVTITETRQSEREYEERIIETRTPGTMNQFGTVFWLDVETGLMVWNVAKFEAWIGGEGHGSDS